MKKLIGLFCCLVSLSTFASDKPTVQSHRDGIFSPKNITVEIPQGEYVTKILMGCANGRCYHTIVTIKDGSRSHPYTYILRTYEGNLNGGVTEIVEKR